MSDFLDLDKVIASEDAPEPFRFRLRGEKFDVPILLRPSQKRAFTKATEDKDLDEMLRSLFGDDTERLLALDLYDNEVVAILKYFGEHYKKEMGIDLGEASASSTSPSSTSKRSRQTSRTGSTSTRAPSSKAA